MVIITCKILFSKNEFLLLTTCQAWRIILPNVIVNLLLELMFETTFNSSKLSVELLHKLILAKHNWTLFLLNLLSRLVNRRPGRILDLLLSFAVELVNCFFKATNCTFKISCDFISKLPFNFCTNFIPHFTQPLVHGLGGAFLLAGGRKGIVCRRFKLLIKFLSNRRDSVQDASDVCAIGAEKH
ncbi:HEAT repeat-containing isoform 1, putative [Babesia ovata]|nr:HEAT repeat-containing isoform 1, putative [Babesia ovata]GBE62991.1 HEAT repeat-containing isoform 1, putative [Babesia ovata]